VPAVVLGIGNMERGDDGAGRSVARLVRHMLGERASVVELDGEATTILAALDGAAEAYIVDACVSKAPPGTVHRIDAAAAPLPQACSDLSTHGFGLAAAIELGRSLEQLPARLVVYAIEGESFEAGAALSPAVRDAVVLVADRIRSDIEEQGMPCTKPR
jgi:hydrogenase maturation protease